LQFPYNQLRISDRKDMGALKSILSIIFLQNNGDFHTHILHFFEENFPTRRNFLPLAKF